MKNNVSLLLPALFLLSFLPVKAQDPPATWQEHWFEHNQVLTRVYYNAEVAIYYDKDVNRSITWPNQYLDDVWRYTKRVYGNFGSEGRLYAIFHAGKYSGGHPSTYFDASHDYRNTIDVGASAANAWTSGTGNDLDLTTHEVAHIVEGASKGVHNSPAFGIWGDSKWAEIFNYDVYVGLGRTSDATRWYNLMQAGTDNFPRANTHWFKDWFYPIYSQYGGSAVLNQFFTLLSQKFPKNGQDYARNMNWGEFVHFWSGAAGTNLKPLATSAFGWPAEWETQFVQAQKDFPLPYSAAGATFYRDINYGGTAVYLPVGDYTLSALQARGIRNDDISSLKVSAGYQVVLYEHNNFAGASTTRTGDVSWIGNDWNDRVSSLRVSKVASTRLAASPETASDWLVYPNPVADKLFVQAPTELLGGQLRVIQSDGRTVLSRQATAGPVDVASLPPGVYTLVVRKNGQVLRKRFVKL